MIAVNLTVEQGWAVYDLTVAKAVALEANEDYGRCDLGSRRYRDAASTLRASLMAAEHDGPTAQEQHGA